MDDNTSLSCPRANERLTGLPSYGRGRAATAEDTRHRLGSNECASRPSPAVVDAARRAMEDSNRYPDLRGESLAGALADRFSLMPENVAVAAGSVMLIEQLLRAFCDHGDDVVVAWRSYEAYPIITGAAGVHLTEVPLDADLRIDPAALLSAIGPSTRAVLICNPNNPSGTALTPEALDRLIDAIPGDRLILLDEAYAEFDAASDVATTARRAGRGNVAVLRTFSKAWALAGLRVGYCLAPEPIIAAVQTLQPPFPVARPAIAAALAALGEEDQMAARVAQTVEERTRMTKGLRDLQIPVINSLTNFIWLPVGAEAEGLTAHFRTASIIVRCFAGEGIRISIGDRADTEAVLAAARIWQQRNAL